MKTKTKKNITRRTVLKKFRPEKTPKVLDLVPMILTLKSILVPIDFSDAGKEALRYAVPFAQQFGAKITLLHVVEPVFYPVDYAYSAADTGELEKSAKQKLDTMAERMGRGAFSETLVRSGAPFYEIGEVAKSLETDLIIVATHGRTGLKHVLLGSTAERVARHAPCPVLVVRKSEHEFV